MKNIFQILFLALFISVGTLILSAVGFKTIEALLIVLGLELTLYFAKPYLPKNLSLVSVCGAISGNIAFDCDVPMQSGTRDKAWIINLEDIDVITYNTNKMIVEEITLKVGKTAYFIDGQNNSIMPKCSLVKLAYTDMYDHIVKMLGFDISPTVKENLEGMKSGRYVVITENVYKGTSGNSAFEIYGLNVGLEITILEKDPNNQDTQGAFDFTFATNKNKEPKMPLTFFDTDYATTKALIEGLL